MNKRHNIFYDLILLCFTLCLSGCEKQTLQYRIGVSQCSQDEWRDKMNTEIEREALIYPNLSVEIRSVKDNNRRQIADIEYFINQKVDLIIVSPNEAEALTAVEEKAIAAGIRIIEIDRRSNARGITAYVGADNKEIGRSIGEYMAYDLKGTGKIIELTGVAKSTTAVERHQGLMESLQQYPQMQIVASVDAGWLEQDAYRVTDSLLDLYPDIDLIFAHNDRMAKGAYDAAKLHQLDQTMHFVGIDALNGKGYGVDLVLDDILDASFIYPTGGDKAIDIAMKALQGQDFEHTTVLSTALIDPSNARIMQMQAGEIIEQDSRIRQLNHRIDNYLTQVNTQRMLLGATLLIIVLFCVVITLVFRALRIKKMLNDKLATTNNKLRHTTQQLKEATQAKLSFFTNVSHDFRTPLTLIDSPIRQLLDRGNLPAEEKQLLQMARKNIDILLRLINDILDFRKIDEQQKTPTLTTFDLCSYVSEWCKSFQLLARQKHIHFLLKADDCNGLMMTTDSDMTERIIFNLLSNAFKFTPENGHIQAELTPTTIAPDIPAINIAISDSGCGISPENKNMIFEQFYQENIHSKGSGIGLSVVKAFAELQGGSVSVESERGKGSTFIVVLPQTVTKSMAETAGTKPIAQLKPVAEAASPDTTTASPIDKATDAESRASILIIDDNVDVRQYFRSLLQDSYTVIEAQDGAEGLRTAMRQVPDLIICDVLMPVMDGFKCCHELKKEVRTSHIPVLMLTACAMDEQRIQGFECGADAYIAKPFNYLVLLAQIKNLLANRRHLKQVFGDSTSLSHENVSHIDKDFITRFKELIDKRMSESELSVEDLGEQMGLSRTQLYRKVKALTNYSPNELLRITRLKQADSLLNTTDKSVAEITYEVGFTTPSYFTKCYKEYFGKLPTERRG